jgi:hypothetical protein
MQFVRAGASLQKVQLVAQMSSPAQPCQFPYSIGEGLIPARNLEPGEPNIWKYHIEIEQREAEKGKRSESNCGCHQFLPQARGFCACVGSGCCFPKLYHHGSVFRYPPDIFRGGKEAVTLDTSEDLRSQIRPEKFLFSGVYEI